jgi:hypothetical protein
VNLATALETSLLLSEKRASLRGADPRVADFRERQALVDFAAFGLVKAAGMGELLQLGKKPLAWGLGLGLPALGVGHALISDAHHQGSDLIRDARNQALLTAAGVGGMQSLGGLLQGAMRPRPSFDTPSIDDAPQKIAADIMVDDVLESAYDEGAAGAKHAALIHLIVHRMDAMHAVRSILR